MGERRSITLRPEKIRFTENCIKMTDSRSGRYKIPYKNLVQAWIRGKDCTGAMYEPEITDITEDMEGELFIRDSKNCFFEIQTELTGKAAGRMLSELSVHAPYILIGKTDWINLEDRELCAEISSMVKRMRECWRETAL